MSSFTHNENGNIFNDWTSDMYTTENVNTNTNRVGNSSTVVGLKANYFEQQLSEQLESLPSGDSGGLIPFGYFNEKAEDFSVTKFGPVIEIDKDATNVNTGNLFQNNSFSRNSGTLGMRQLNIPSFEQQHGGEQYDNRSYLAQINSARSLELNHNSPTSSRSPHHQYGNYQQQPQLFSNGSRDYNMNIPPNNSRSQDDYLNGYSNRFGQQSGSPSHFAGNQGSPSNFQSQRYGAHQQQSHGRMTQQINGRHVAPSAPVTTFNGAVYQVQFKQAFRDFILGPQCPSTISVGDFVIVECDRGEDLGVVIGSVKMSEFVERRYLTKASLDDDANDVGRILRLATVAERQQLPEKYHDEQNIIQVCTQLSSVTFKLPMRVLDAEYQYDRRKLTIYYAADTRIDFRELVRDLFSAYRTRIWMKKVSPGHAFAPVDFAVMSLSSGVQFAPK